MNEHINIRIYRSDIAHLLNEKYPNVIMVMDEVYEKLVYDRNKHIHMASIVSKNGQPAWNQTITVSSAGTPIYTYVCVYICMSVHYDDNNNF